MFRCLLRLACAVSLLGSLSAQTFAPEKISQPAQKVRIRRIIFQNARLLSPQDRREISQALRSEEGGVGSLPVRGVSDAADEAAERVRATYQNSGYFKVQVEAKSAPVVGENDARYDVVVRVSEEGKQYRLGDLHIVHVKAFPESQLRALFLVKRGEIFSRKKITKGLENLRYLYGSEGYVNFTSVPLTEFDEEDAGINLQVDVDEGRVFRWGDLHVNGMRDQDKQILLNGWEGLRGRIYRSSNQELGDFFRRFFRPLRRGASLADCAVVRVDGVGGSVDVYLNLLWNQDIVRQVAEADNIMR